MIPNRGLKPYFGYGSETPYRKRITTFHTLQESGNWLTRGSDTYNRFRAFMSKAGGD